MNALAMAIADSRKVAALFVDPDGYYPKLSVDCWDAARDARLYDGPHPVVAHPPCQLWVNLAHVNYKRYGGGHNRPGNDGGCFASALYNVRRWGGVLEHPAGSNAWEAHGLTPPGETVGWRQTALCEWVCEVWQTAYGHPARKKTWLFYCGPQPAARGSLGPSSWNASGRLVRSEQADARKEGGVRDACGICGVVDRARSAIVALGERCGIKGEMTMAMKIQVNRQTNGGVPGVMLTGHTESPPDIAFAQWLSQAEWDALVDKAAEPSSAAESKEKP